MHKSRADLHQMRMQGLNVNGGRGKTSEIRLRLRPHHAPGAFLPYEDVLGTMLHEITHNVRSPHDAQFYKILDEVTKECEDFMARGVSGTGTGFDGPSMGRLGSHAFVPTHNPPLSSLKSIQLKCVPRPDASSCIVHTCCLRSSGGAHVCRLPCAAGAGRGQQSQHC